VPPELDDLCARATAENREARPSARELADGIQAYLDGDRDLARRRELASEAVRSAQAALARSGDDARAQAMREAGRALALDPTSLAAQDLVASMLVKAPDRIPAAALAAADAARARYRQHVARWAARGYLGFLIALVMMFTLPLRQQWQVIMGVVVTIGAYAVIVRISRRPMPMRSGWYLALLALSSGILLASGLVFGPLLVLPMFVIGATAGFLAQPTSHHWSLIVGSVIAPLIGLVALELLGVLPPTFRIVDGSLVLTAPVLDLTTWSALVIIGGSLLVQTANTTFIAMSGRASAERSQDLVHAQRWHLQQLLPSGTAGGEPAQGEPPAGGG
jgi:serine/threonine-protein kinase